MLFRPAFCCNCGEKIVRDEWRIWTSRRFCALCETEFKGIDLIPKVIVGLGLLLAISGMVGYVGGPSPPVTSETAFKSQKLSAGVKPAPLSSNSAVSPTANSAQTATVKPEINEQPQREKRTSDETVYFCGAITKKGTPCTRRVKTKGFCWQHAKSGQLAPARF
jgi:hypothetical protein